MPIRRERRGGRAVGLVIAMAAMLSGCDYWPPALQTQIEQLRSELQTVTMEKAQLQTQLHDDRESSEQRDGAPGSPGESVETRECESRKRKARDRQAGREARGQNGAEDSRENQDRHAVRPRALVRRTLRAITCSMYCSKERSPGVPCCSLSRCRPVPSPARKPAWMKSSRALPSSPRPKLRVSRLQTVVSVCWNNP